MAELLGRKILVLDRFRVTVAVFLIGALITLVWLVILTGRVNRAEAARVATIDANYNICIQSIPLLQKLNEEIADLDFPAPTPEECARRRDAALDA